MFRHQRLCVQYYFRPTPKKRCQLNRSMQHHLCTLREQIGTCSASPLRSNGCSESSRLPRAETTDSASEYSNRPILRAMRLYSSRELMVRKLETIPLATRNF